VSGIAALCAALVTLQAPPAETSAFRGLYRLGEVVSAVPLKDERCALPVEVAAIPKGIFGTEYVLVSQDTQAKEPIVYKASPAQFLFKRLAGVLAECILLSWCDSCPAGQRPASLRFWTQRIRHRGLAACGVVDIQQLRENCGRAAIIGKVNFYLAAVKRVRLSFYASIVSISTYLTHDQSRSAELHENIRSLQFSERPLGNARRAADVPRLDNQDHPLKERSQSQGICSVEKIPTVLRLAFCGLGYIGGALLALLGFHLSDYKWNRLSTSLFGIGLLGAAFGMGLLAVSAGCG